MARGTVKYTALMAPHQEIYNGRSAKTWNVSQSGSFPASKYAIVSAVVKYDIRNVYASNRHMVVSRRDGSTDTTLGDVPTGKSGTHTEKLSTSANYENIKTIKLDGVERWACQLRGGSYVTIEVTWEETEPVIVEPPKPVGPVLITGTTSNDGEKDIAVRTELTVAFDGVNISEQINKYLLSMSYTDNEEDEADDLQIKLQDADGQWLQKWLNDTLQAAGYGIKGVTSTKGLTIKAGIKIYEPSGRISQVDCGTFELDSMKASGPPSTVTIKGTSLPYGNGVRTEDRSKAWEGYTLMKIGREIANSAGLGFLYDCPTDPYYRRVEQAKQTDIAFLQELCHKAGFSLKVASQRLIIFDQARYEAVQAVATIRWMDGTYTKYDLSTSEGDVHYAMCTVRYYHPGKKQTIQAEAKADDFDEDADDNLNLLVTDQRVESVAEAKELANKMLRLHNKYEKKCTFTMRGNPMLGAGLTVVLDGFGLWDGKYLIKQCKHEIGTGGYTTKITLRTIPDKNVERMVKEEDDSTTSSSGSGNSGKKPSSSSSSTTTHWELKSGATIYSKPPSQSGSKSLGTKAAGTRVTLLGSTSGSYTYVNAGGTTGYVSSSKLHKV